LRGSETILLVEDQEQVRTVALAILKRGGYRVIVAQNAGEALLFCEQHPGTIHLLLTDVVMPGMSGTELAKPKPSIQPAIPLAAMPPLADAESDDAAKLQGARLRYSRLAQNFPSQFNDFDNRLTEIERVLRDSLPEPSGPSPTTLPSTPTLNPVAGPSATPAPASQPFRVRQPTTAASSDPAGGGRSSADNTTTPETGRAYITVTDLNALADRLEEEARLARGLSERSFDGKSVSLRPDTATRLRVLVDLLLTKEAGTNRTVVRPLPDGTRSDDAANRHAIQFQYDR